LWGNKGYTTVHIILKNTSWELTLLVLLDGILQQEGLVGFFFVRVCCPSITHFMWAHIRGVVDG
jgi:hypothetical protein